MGSFVGSATGDGGRISATRLGRTARTWRAAAARTLARVGAPSGAVGKVAGHIPINEVGPRSEYKHTVKPSFKKKSYAGGGGDPAQTFLWLCCASVWGRIAGPTASTLLAPQRHRHRRRDHLGVPRLHLPFI